MTLNYETSCSDCEHFMPQSGGGDYGFCPQMQEALRQAGMPDILPGVSGGLRATSCACFEPTDACREWMSDADDYNASIVQTNRETAKELATCR